MKQSFTVKGLMNGPVYSNMIASQEFRKKHQEKYAGVSQITFIGQGYDLVYIINARLKQGQNAQEIITSLKTIDSFEGVLGEYTYHEEKGDRYFSQPIVLKRIDKDRISAVI